MSEERLSEVTRSVSLLARWSPIPADSGWAPEEEEADDDEDVEDTDATCTDRLPKLSGPTVYGRLCGVRRLTACRCSRALPLGTADAWSGGDEEEAVAAAAIPVAEAYEKVGGEESWWRWGDWGLW